MKVASNIGATMSDRRTEARSILDASPSMARWTWIINGSLFAIGASVSTLVYLSGSGGVMRRVESVESQLFTFLFFQLVLFLMPLFMDLNWRGFQSVFHHSEQLQRIRSGRYREMDSVLLYYGMCSMMICMESLVFVMALASALMRWQMN